VVYDKQSHPTSVNTLPHLAFYYKTRKTSSINKPTKDLAYDTADSGLCNVGEFDDVCVPPKTKKEE
jgi:hypothetical protein